MDLKGQEDPIRPGGAKTAKMREQKDKRYPKGEKGPKRANRQKVQVQFTIPAPTHFSDIRIAIKKSDSFQHHIDPGCFFQQGFFSILRSWKRENICIILSIFWRVNSKLNYAGEM